MSNIFTDADRIEISVMFMESYVKIGERAYDGAGLNPATLYMYTVKYKKQLLKDYPELYKAYTDKREEIKKENRLKGIEKTKQVYVEFAKKKEKYGTSNPIIKYLINNNITSIKYNDFIDTCIMVFPECETSVINLMKKARKFNIDITKNNKIIN